MAGTFIAFQRALLQNIVKAPFGCAPMSNARTLIGKREIVGFGFNGQPSYHDRIDFPMPAIRWKEPTPDVCALREKEKGDWNQLSVEEKKALYRASFCQTFAELNAPTGEWKSILGVGLLIVASAIWGFYGLKAFVYSPLPESFNKENREAQLRRIIDLQINPIQGISSKWDYDKDDWKK